MSKVFKAVVIGVLIAVGGYFLAPLLFGAGAATPFIGLFGLVEAPLLAAAIGGGIVGGLASLLAPSMDLTTVRNRQRVSVDPNASMKWVVGETALASDIIFAAHHGDGNQYYSYIIAGAGHLIDSYQTLYINDEAISFTGQAADSPWSGALWRQTLLGTEVQTGFVDIDASDEFGTNLWPVTADGLGMAHYRLRFAVDHAKVSSGIPTRITQVARGGPVYDPRLDSTRGGAGAHRADDQTTWEYTNGGDDIGANWALIVLRYLIGWEINGDLIIGMGINPDDIDMVQAMAAANVCEASIDGKPRFRVGGILPVTNDHAAIIRQLEGAINGKIAIIGGMYYIWAPNDDLTPFSTIGESDLIREAGVVFVPSGPMESLYNTGRGSFVSDNPQDLFNLVPYPEVIEATAVTEDGGIRILNHDFSMVQDVSIAERVSRHIVRRSRFGATWKFALGPKGLTFQPFSVTTLNIQETNNVNVTVRIINMSYSVSGAVVMEVIEEDSSIYDTTAPLGTPVTQLDPGGFDPNTSIDVTGLAAVASTVRGDTGTAIPALTISWDDPGAFVQETEVQFKIATTSVWLSAPLAQTDFTSAILVGLEPGSLHDIRARHITRFGIVGDFATTTGTTPSIDTREPTNEGAVELLTYDDLDTTQLAAGQSRYAMLTARLTNTSGSQNDFQLTDAILINKKDKAGINHTMFYSNMRIGDIIIYRPATSRWYVFEVDELYDSVDTGNAEAYKFGVVLLQSSDPDPTVNIPTAAGTDVTFEFHRSQFVGDQAGVIDPDFDLTPIGDTTIPMFVIDNGVAPDIFDLDRSFHNTPQFWYATASVDAFDSTDASPVYTIPTVKVQANGVNGSNSILIKFGDVVASGATSYQQQVILVHTHRFRANSGDFNVTLRARNQFTDSSNYHIEIRGYADPRDTTSIDVASKAFTIPATTTTWTEFNFKVVNPSPNPDAQYWEVTIRIVDIVTVAFSVANTNLFELELDSIFVTPAPKDFGDVTDTGGGKASGLVPSTSAGQASLVLQGDGAWVANTGAGATEFNDLSDVNLAGAANNDLLYRSAAVWIDTAGLLTWDGSNLSATNIGGIPEANLVDATGAFHDGFSDFVQQEHIRWDLTGAEDIHIDRIAAGAVTQHEAVLTILESQITDAAILARLNSPEAILQLWTFNAGIKLPDNQNLFWGDDGDITFDFNTTDLVLAAVIGSPDWNITGFAAINAGTVDADFDAITGTTFNAVPLTAAGAATNYLDESGNYSVPVGSGSEINDLSVIVTWANVPNANITQGSVTQHEAALTILESQITNGTILARLNSPETVLQLWAFNAGIKLPDNQNLFFGNDGDITFDFNATDLVLAAVIGTPDWNITGFGSINAGTVDADFDALTATSYEGILAANLIDATGAFHDGFSDYVAQEHIRWDLTGAEDIHEDRLSNLPDFLRADVADTKTNGILRFNDNVAITFGTGDDVGMSFSGAQFNITQAAPDQIYALRDAPDIRIYDSADASWMQLHANGSVNFDINAGGTAEDLRFANWAEINIFSGAELQIFGPGNSEHGGFQHDDTDFNLQLSGGTTNFDIRGGVRVLLNDMYLRLDSRGVGGSREIEVFYDDAAERIILEVTRETGPAAVLRMSATAGGNIKWIDSQNTGKIYMQFVTNSDIRIRDGYQFRIYDSTDADWMQFDHDDTDFNIGAKGAGTVDLNFTGISGSYTFDSVVTIDGEFATQDHTVTGNTSGAIVDDHSGTPRDIGFNLLPIFNEDTGDVLEAGHCGHINIKTNTSGISLTTGASGDTDFPVGGVTHMINYGTSANYSFLEGSGVTIFVIVPGTGAVDSNGGFSLLPGGFATCWRKSTTEFYCWGAELVP